jgi:hypothetical protein
MVAESQIPHYGAPERLRARAQELEERMARIRLAMDEELGEDVTVQRARRKP